MEAIPFIMKLYETIMIFTSLENITYRARLINIKKYVYL